ncbi:TetR/AcrR family transcriptional regulator [Nonomuraea longispora]|uniref:TetR/AcrR family transcriptional regulator n=1 Tax=Nonomuraea longispora TaxID=1848320 RepID=A0A4R4N6H4_9ACTN|nr:TetR/AcrR family transcriptional regulator [Nonomuraea longispora]TDC04431.1 TetR/AcrR family transcriptional regulator [Nonomuraea longispora]
MKDTKGEETSAAPTPRLARVHRREQILATATPIFAQAGLAGTSLDDIATAAGVSRMILYRHFASKDDLYQAALKRAAGHLAQAVGDEVTEDTVQELVGWASADPDAFRLLFHQAAREPRFRSDIDKLREDMAQAVFRSLAETIDDRIWAKWAAQLSLTVTVEAIMTWLDIGRPQPARAATRIGRAVRAVLQSAQDD